MAIPAAAVVSTPSVKARRRRSRRRLGCLVFATTSCVR
jgi:hypothetical protein